MLKNLKIEWLKLRSYRTFWVLIILFAISMVGVNVVVFQNVNSIKGPTSFLIGRPFEFPDLWQSITYLSGFLLFFPGLLMLMLVTNEYSFKTHRQNIIDGTSRMQFALTKIMMAVLFSVLCVALAIIVTLCIWPASGSSFTLENSSYLLYFFLEAFTYILTGLLFGFILKKSGLAIGLYFIYVFIIKNIIWGLFTKNHSDIGDYIPVKSADNLISNPFLKTVSKQFFKDANFPMLMIFTLVYLAAFIFIIQKKFTTQDL